MKRKKILEKKPLKRIEGKLHSDDGKLRVRASRTGGVNAAYHPFRGITFNTKHGVRVSKTFKGLTLGLQGKSTVFRGRWSSKGGLLNTNLSKSGFSFSTKSEFGTYNWTRPNRSSFKFAGVQFRGRKAAGPALFFALLHILTLIANALLPYILVAIVVAFDVLKNFSIYILNLLAAVAGLLWAVMCFVVLDLPLQLMGKNDGSKASEIVEAVSRETRVSELIKPSTNFQERAPEDRGIGNAGRQGAYGGRGKHMKSNSKSKDTVVTVSKLETFILKFWGWWAASGVVTTVFAIIAVLEDSESQGPDSLGALVVIFLMGALLGWISFGCFKRAKRLSQLRGLLAQATELGVEVNADCKKKAGHMALKQRVDEEIAYYSEEAVQRRAKEEEKREKAAQRREAKLKEAERLREAKRLEDKRVREAKRLEKVKLERTDLLQKLSMPMDEELVDAFFRGEVRIGMPIEVVNNIWGKGYEEKVEISKTSHQLRCKYVRGARNRRGNYTYRYEATFKNGLLHRYKEL